MLVDTLREAPFVNNDMNRALSMEIAKTIQDLVNMNALFGEQLRTLMGFYGA